MSVIIIYMYFYRRTRPRPKRKRLARYDRDYYNMLISFRVPTRRFPRVTTRLYDFRARWFSGDGTKRAGPIIIFKSEYIRNISLVRVRASPSPVKDVHTDACAYATVPNRQIARILVYGVKKTAGSNEIERC